MVAIGGNRYVVGNKYLYFHSDSTHGLTVAHIDDLESRIVCLTCDGAQGRRKK